MGLGRVSVGRVVVELEDNGIAWVTFDNVERHNAMNRDMFVQLRDACLRLDPDPAARVLVVRGAGSRAFSAGADIGELGSRLGPERHAEGAAASRDDAGALALLGVTKPVIAMIQGYCIGGGLLLALTADLRVAADDAQFAVPAGRLGVGYPTVGMRLLTNLVGPSKATEIAFTAERYDADAAVQMGLVNRVVPKTDLEHEVRALATTIASQAPLSLRAAKAAVAAAGRGWQREDVERAEAMVRDCWASIDFAEGRKAFGEKRAAVFEGR